MLEQTLQRTPLFAEHQALGGKLVPFAGWEMPVQYPRGINAEHQAVRTAAGLFDASHMGELELWGERALDLLQYVTSNDASKLEVGQAQYSTLLNEDGRVIDDLLVYRFPDHYFVVVNASGREADRAWFARWAAQFGVEVRDRSDELGLIALQGPNAPQILARLTDADLAALPYYRFVEGTVAGVPALVSRTGYTGEAGYELFLPWERTADIWRALLDAGRDDGLVPAGLGARDSLRLEMGYILYGNDLDLTRTPLEANLGWVTRLDKGDFLGRDVLQRQKEEGVAERLAGFRLLERGFPRHDYEIRHDGQRVGSVSSGTLSPSLGYGIGLAYLPLALTRPGTRLEIVVRGQALPAEVVRPPFYTAGTAKG